MSKVQKNYKRNFYHKNQQNRAHIDVNLKGFLCSCNNREKDCIRESYNILNKYADIIWPKAEETTEKSEDIEDDLQKELNELRAEKKDTKRFQLVDAGAKNFLFIKTTVEDPVKLAETILQEIYEKKTQETRFLLRLVPVETTCKAYLKDIEKAFESLCERHFSTQAKTFSVIFNHRNNNSVSRDEVIKSLASQIFDHGKAKSLEHKVDLKNAEVCVVVEVIRGFAYLSVVPNFIKYKKYNLLAFCEQQKECPNEEGELHDVAKEPECKNVDNKSD